MVIMALDHVRDYFHVTANTDDPLNLTTTTPALFFTRWVTHFCAPIFVFLTGASVYLQSLRKTNKELSLFLLKRGLWLILMEITIIAFAWTFNPYFNIIPLQVIWAIGISMVILGLLLLFRISYTAILVLGLIIIFGHNLLDISEASLSFKAGFWRDLLHHGFFTPYSFAPNHFVLLGYTFPVWTGLMMTGYCAGILFTSKFSAEQRQRLLIRTSTVLILFFGALRFINLYGDPADWTVQKNGLYTFLSFINVDKYPPSLLYLCITIGPALLLLSVTEKFKNKFTNITAVFGRTAFFYYIIHIYLIHFISAVCFFARGHSLAEESKTGLFPFLFVAPGEGYGLSTVYFVWAAVVITLYPLCKRYDRYKYNHKEKWWLSYL